MGECDEPIGTWIKRLRADSGLTQAEFGRLVGVSNVTVSRWEQGTVVPRPAMRRRCEALVRQLAASSPPAPSDGRLPAASSRFIGRARELALVPPLLRTGRLLTLRGPGGSGKTRLALELARRFDSALVGEARFVDLSPLPAGSDIAPAVAAAIGLRPSGAAPLSDQVAAFIDSRAMLIILDNAEHVLSACRELAAALLIACPSLRLLVTSREELGLAEERMWHVAPLPLPEGESSADIMRSEAVGLFIARAREADALFQFEDDDAPTLARLCRRLDGLPLALELAAARTPLLTLDQIDRRLDDRFRLLRTARVGLPARQQALDAAIAWSVDLLARPEQTLFRRLSVFAGSFDLEAAEAVAGPTALDGIAPLVRQSLIEPAPRRERDEPARWRLLESIRAYAAESLRQSDDDGDARGRHAVWFTRLAESAAARWQSADQPSALRDLERDADNLRAALAWATANDPALAARLGAALWRWWQANGRYAEGEAWLERIAEIASDETVAGAETRFGLARLRLRRGKRAEAQTAAHASKSAFIAAGHRAGEARSIDLLGLLAARRGDAALARALHDEALTIARAIGARRVQAEALLHLGAAANAERDQELAERRYAEAWALIQGDGDLEAEAVVLNNLGDLAARRGDGRRAAGYFERSLARSRQLEHPEGIAAKLVNLAEARLLLGEIEMARSLAEEGVSRYRTLADRERLADALYVQGLVQSTAGDPTAAATLGEALSLYQSLGDRGNQGQTLELLADVALRHGDAETAARWLGGGAKLRAGVGEPPYAPDRLDAALTRVRAALGPARADALMDAGRAEPEAIMLVSASTYEPARPPSMEGLTPRQREIVSLVAEGRSNREIGLALGISARTVERHLSAIFAATGVSRRAAAVRVVLGDAT